MAKILLLRHRHNKDVVLEPGHPSNLRKNDIIRVEHQHGGHTMVTICLYSKMPSSFLRGITHFCRRSSK